MVQKNKSDQYAVPIKEDRTRWIPSLVWVVPVIAALVGLFLIAKTIHDKGPTIAITFETAEGLEAGKTKVKYKNVDIGVVRTIKLTPDNSHVIVDVELSKDADKFVSKDTRYWVVRPRIALTGISGLGTLLSGAYIGADPGVDSKKSFEFTGLELPPLVTRDTTGKQYTLHAKQLGSLDIGSPVYFRRIRVGQITAFKLDPDGQGVTLRVFVNAPYDKFVGMNSRFWHASGIDVQMDSAGLKIQTQSITSLVLGGIAFQTPDDVIGPAATENTEFTLAADQVAAFKRPDGVSEPVLLYFDQSLRGLQPGATVEFRGVALGEVKSIGIEYNAKSMTVKMPVLIQLYPERLGAVFSKLGPVDVQKNADKLELLVQRGLRAQLRSASLLTGQLYVALDFVKNAKPAKVDVVNQTIVLPTIPGSMDEMQSQINGILNKLSKVPLDQIGQDLQKTVAGLNATLSNVEQITKTFNNDVTPEMTAMMKDARQTLNNVNRTLSGDSPIQQDVRQTLQELSRAAASIRVLTDYLQQHPEAIIRGKK